MLYEFLIQNFSGECIWFSIGNYQNNKPPETNQPQPDGNHSKPSKNHPRLLQPTQNFPKLAVTSHQMLPYFSTIDFKHEFIVRKVKN